MSRAAGRSRRAGLRVLNGRIVVCQARRFPLVVAFCWPVKVQRIRKRGP